MKIKAWGDSWSRDPELADFTLSGAVNRAGLETVFITLNAPVGSTVATLEEIDGLLLLAVLLDDGDGHFTLDGLALKVAAVPDFESQQPAGKARGIPFYTVTVRGNGPSDSVVDKQFRIGGSFPARTITGSGIDPQTRTPLANDLATLRAAIMGGGAGVCHRASEAPTIYQMGNNSKTDINRSDYTFRGHFRSVIIKDRCMQIDGGNNILIEDLVAKAGSDVGGATLDDRDSLRISHANIDISNLKFQFSEFSLSIDELVSIISGSGPFCRGIVFEYNALYEAIENAGHSEGYHPLGLLIYNNQMDVVIRKNTFIGCPQRSPLVSKANAILVENNVIAYRGDSGGYGGTGFQSTNATLEHGMNTTCIVRGNQYIPLASNRSRAYTFSRIGTGTYIHLAQADSQDSAAYPNHFIDIANWDFSDDPVLRGSHLTLRNGSVMDGAIDWDPFIPGDYGAQETDTPQGREDNVRDVLLNAGACKRDGSGNRIPGVFNKQYADCLNQLLADGTARIMKNLTVDNLHTWYGANWSGGTLGAINDEAPAIVLPN